MNRKEIEKAIEREVEEWPGVSVTFSNPTGKGHPKAKLMFGELIMPVPYAGTPSSSLSIHHSLADVRRTLRKMGAERPKPDPTKEEDEAPYRKPNDGAKLRPDPVVGVQATPAPTVADQLVEAGVATPEQAEIAAASRDSETGVALRGRSGDVVLIDDPASETDEEREAREAREELQRQVDAIEDGVYFDLPDVIYHAVAALGGSALGKLNVSPGTFWRGSWLDPDRPELDEEQTKAQMIGKAYHCARLEPEKFEVRYARKPGKADFTGRVLTSIDGIKKALKEEGAPQTVKDETLEDQCDRLFDTGWQGTILPLELARFEAACAARVPRPIPLDGKTWDEIATDQQRLQNTPEVAEKLEGGFAEVSVFWTDVHGLRCKARFDKLTVQHWGEFKTFDNSKGKELEAAIADAIRYNRYYLAASHYRDAAEAIRGGLPVRGDATPEQRDLIDAIALRDSPLLCWFIFQEKGGVPNLLAKRFQFRAVEDPAHVNEMKIFAGDDPGKLAMLEDALGSKTKLARKGEIEVLRAKKTFALYAQSYPPGVPWAPLEPVGVISDDQFNERWLDGDA